MRYNRIMKKSFSIAYTILVVLLLLGILVFFGRETMQARSARIADFETRAQEYSRRLADTLVEYRDVNKEVAVAKSIMEADPSLVALQVYSHDDGLRLSVVKPAAENFSRTAIIESEGMKGFLASLRYHTVGRPMAVTDMQGMEAVFIGTTLTGAEIRTNLLILLITVLGLFIITIVLILLRPGSSGEFDNDEDEDEEEFEQDFEEAFEEDSRSPGEISEDGTDFHLPSMSEDFDISPDFSDSMNLEEDFDFLETKEDSPFIQRLGKELERAASFNQDLTLLVFRPGFGMESSIREAFEYDDLMFNLDNGNLAVIEMNKDLDTVLAATEDLIRRIISYADTRETRAGIASRNGRLLEPDRLIKEALAALERTTEDTNIVAFRSNPERYREYLRKSNKKA